LPLPDVDELGGDDGGEVAQHVVDLLEEHESPTVRGFSRSDLAANGFTNVETLFLAGIALERGGDWLLVVGEVPEELGT